MKDNKIFKISIIVLNIIGIICLIYYMIPYIRHDMSIPNPNSMIVSYSWDACGFILTLGLIPLLIANTLAFIFIKTKLRILYFIPSLVCLIIVAHYLVFSTNWKDAEYKEPIESMKCSTEGRNYIYKIYKEDDGTYSLGMDENDKLPLSIVDYTDKDTIISSIEEYYRANNGMCS